MGVSRKAHLTDAKVGNFPCKVRKNGEISQVKIPKTQYFKRISDCVVGGNGLEPLTLSV